jgi:ubiquinone/menaquinone biosynthesis C-methylase UbiE
MVDGDRFCADIDELQAATVENARRDLMKLAIPVTWIVGTHDAWMDPKKINDIMSAAAPGDRKIIEVDTGHTPTSSDEALAQFQLMSSLIFSQIHGAEIEAVIPPRGLIGAISSQEWARVRKQDALPTEEYWRSYLLSDEKHGYDLLRYVPAYREFAQLQATEAIPHGRRVLDLGSGTGIVANALLEHDPITLTCADIVDSALERLRNELGHRSNVDFIRANADGNARTAMRRWIRGELSSVYELVGRVPGVSRSTAEQLASKMDPDLHALLRGADLDAEQVRRDRGLPEHLEPLLHDINVLAQTELGVVSEANAINWVKKMPRSVFEGDVGLPFADEAFDSVVCSLLLSYLQHPADCLSECRRVLQPGGTLVVSSMRPDADTSVIYREFIETLESRSDEQLAAERDELLNAARGLLNKAAQLMRDEKEGRFCFYTPDQLSAMVRRAGFNHVRIRQAYGNPPQAIVVSCRKPKTAQ